MPSSSMRSCVFKLCALETGVEHLHKDGKMGTCAGKEAHPQVKGGAVGQADALDPAVGALHLGVPAVLCIVRHLVLQVLPEAHPLRSE